MPFLHFILSYIYINGVAFCYLLGRHGFQHLHA